MDMIPLVNWVWNLAFTMAHIWSSPILCIRQPIRFYVGRDFGSQRPWTSLSLLGGFPFTT
jgi:hypothetical protein